VTITLQAMAAYTCVAAFCLLLAHGFVRVVFYLARVPWHDDERSRR